MGMDVYGLDPAAPEGEYFRCSVWRWHPLADLVCALEPSLTAACENWHSNDGDGLDAEASRNLARTLKQALDAGAIAVLIAGRNAALDALPAESCNLCHSTGIRIDDVGQRDGQPSKVIGTDTEAKPNHPRFSQTGWCNGCDGTGSIPAFQTHYRCDADDVAEFTRFLDACGGFEIC